MEEKTFTDFCAEWNERQPKDKDVRIIIMPLEYSGDIYGIEIRFPGSRKYSCTAIEFSNMKDSIRMESRGTIFISSSVTDFEKGIISFNTSFCNHDSHGYYTSAAIKTIQTILKETLPGFKK